MSRSAATFVVRLWVEDGAHVSDEDERTLEQAIGDYLSDIDHDGPAEYLQTSGVWVEVIQLRTPRPH